MTLWVDADSCPRRVRQLVANAAQRVGVVARFVANRSLPLPRRNGVEMIVVGDADAYLCGHARPADIVVTRDIPLAACLVAKGIGVLNDRGTVYNRENVAQRLSMRTAHLDAPYPSRPTSSFGRREIQAFADTLDRELVKRLRIV